MWIKSEDEEDSVAALAADSETRGDLMSSGAIALFAE